MIKPQEQIFWEEVHRHLTALARAVKEYKLSGQEPEPITTQRYVQFGPPDPVLAAEFFRSQGVKVVD